MQKSKLFLPLIATALTAGMLSGCTNNNKPSPSPSVTTYIVSFNGNGGTGSMALVQNVSGEYTLPECSFTAPSGKEFAGWKVNGEGETLPAGSKVTVSSNIELVAQWKNIGEDNFTYLKSQVLSLHNYTLKVHSYLVGYEDDPETIYDDTFVMINDKAFYNNFYSGYSGVIYQKNQGYVNFIMAGTGEIVPTTFYSTNPSVGVSDVYDLVAENFFLGTWEKDATNPNKYACSNVDVVTVGCNFTGYIESSWFNPPASITAEASADKITFTVTFETYFIEDGDTKIANGVCTISLEKIGSTTNQNVEAYIANPTKTYTNPTSWSADDVVLFNSYFAEYIPPFLNGLTYSMHFDTEETYNGTDFYLTDYGCGNVIQSYKTILGTVGFNPTSSNPNKLVKVFEDETSNKKTTWEIEFGYKGPSETYYGHTVGFYYPAGLFQMKFHCRTTNMSISTLRELNEYIVSNNMTYAVPLLPFGDEVTQIKDFDDRTANMNQLYGEHYLLYTSTTPYIKLYVNSYATAKADIEAYIDACVAKGYSVVTKQDGMVYCTNTTWNDNYESYITIADPDLITSTNYQGYFILRFNVYIPEKNVPAPGYPTISLQTNANISSSRFEDINGNIITAYDYTKDDGYFYAKFTCVSGYAITGVSVKNDSSAYVDYDSTLGRWTIKPSDITLTSIVLIAETAESSSYTLAKSTNVINGSIMIISPAAGEIPAVDADSTVVQFNAKPDDGYEVKRVYLLEDESYPITKDPSPMKPNGYYFTMPHHNATICAEFQVEGSEPPAPTYVLDSISLTGTSGISFNVNDAFNHDTVVVTAHYTNGGTDRDVTSSASFSTPDMTTPGNKNVTVSYTEGTVTRTAQYTINVTGTVPDPDEPDLDAFEGSYTANYNESGTIKYILTFNDDGTGTYQRTGASAASLSFTYTRNGNNISITLNKYESSAVSPSNPGPSDYHGSKTAMWRLFPEREYEEQVFTNNSGVYDPDNHLISINLHGSDKTWGTTNRTFSK